MSSIRCESLEAIKEKLPSLKEDLQDAATFKEFYMFCFDFSKDQETHKFLSLEVAVQVWELVMAGRYSMMDKWFAFLETENPKNIQKDVWQLFLDFTIQVKLDTSNYDDCEAGGAWPCLIDDYVDWLKENKHV